MLKPGNINLRGCSRWRSLGVFVGALVGQTSFLPALGVAHVSGSEHAFFGGNLEILGTFWWCTLHIKCLDDTLAAMPQACSHCGGLPFSRV